MEAPYILALTLFFLGEIVSAREHVEQGIALYEPRQPRSLTFRSVENPAVGCLTFAALALWWLGYPEQALQSSRKALALAQELAHPFSLGWARMSAAWLHQCRREAQSTQEMAEATLTLASEQGFPTWIAFGTIWYGWALAKKGQAKEGITQLRQGLADLQAMEADPTSSFALLAETYGHAGQAEEGLRVLAEVLAIVDKIGERLYEAELYRLKGELTLQQEASGWRLETSPPSPQASSLKSQASNGAEREAERYFLKAIAIAQKQQAKSWELRAATSLARLWQSQGKRAEAHNLLSEVYNWFTEGFDTKDLQEAKALLDELL